LDALSRTWDGIRGFDGRDYAPKALPWVLIALAAIPRLAQYLLYRPLWLDEAQLALNIVERSARELLGLLDHGQVAPPGYLLLTKLATVLFGPTEYAVRLPSILAGLLALYVFYLVARRVTTGLSAVLGLALFGLAGHAIYYAAECKPYAMDVAVVLLLTWLALDTEDRDTVSWLRSVGLGLAGAAAIWVSFPALFALAAMAVVQGVRSLAQRDGKRLLRLLPAYACWGASFVVLLLVCVMPVRNAPTMSYLDDYWHFGYAFMPLPPTSFEELRWFKTRFFMFFNMTGGFDLPGLAAFAFLVGCLSLFLRNQRAFWLLTLPVFAALFVSAFELYPFHGRMILFLVPCQMILVAEGIAFTMAALRGRAPWVALLLLILLAASPCSQAVRTAIRPKSHHELHRVLEYAQDHWQPGDGLYLRRQEGYSYAFAKRRFDFDDADCLHESELTTKPEQMAAFLEEHLPELCARERMWVPLVYDYRGEIVPFVELLDGFGTRVDSFDAAGASVYCYDLTAPREDRAKPGP